LRAVRVEPAGVGSLTAHIDAEVRGQHRPISMAARYELSGDTLTVSGDTSLRQSDLGLAPFTALMGALAVQDEMRISLHLVATASGVPAGQSSPSSSSN
jgi:hypothetical protein